jgi:cytochrome c peroxidase
MVVGRGGARARAGASLVVLVAGLAALACAAPPGAVAHQAVDPALLALVRPPSAAKSLAGGDDLVERGRQLFTRETFGGNGRTCATCHPPSNNFTLDPAYIAKLRRDDPLFVAERNPRLRALENTALLRRSALILENLDGFDRPGVLRSVSHTLGMSVSTAPDKGSATRAPFPLAAATGWSGDGAPGDGSLRMFAVGGVVQHLTRSLDRVPGRDFRLPTGDELDAMLAFQLSLGRRAEAAVDPADPASLRFRDEAVEEGRRLFHAAPARDGSTRTCSGCHARAGANDRDGNNRLFATGTNLLPNAPACLDPGLAPVDGGFGAAPEQVLDGRATCGGGGAAFPLVLRGTGAFNTPPLVEAADTPPYFHNNAAATLEDAVAFYAGDVFDRSPAGGGRAFALDRAAADRIGAFLRALNALQNVAEADDYAARAEALPPGSGKPWAGMALLQAEDAIRVLSAGPLGELFAATGTVPALRAARLKLALAAATARPGQLAAARVDLARARGLMLQ